MSVVQTVDTGLALMDRLSVPLWLVGADGVAVWLNRAARGLMDLPADAPAATVRAGVPSEALTALLVAETPPAARVTFQAGERTLTVEGRLSGMPEAPHLVLVEAPDESAAGREALRLTEQTVALSYAYPDMRFELRRDGTILDFATASPSELNVPAGRFLMNRVQDVLPEPAGGRIAEALARVAAGEAVAAADFTLPGPQGERSFEARLVALADGGRVLCSVRNVTERTRAEQAARRAHDLLADAVENVPGGFVVCDPDDRLVLCNSRFREIYARSADIIVPGVRFEEIVRTGAARGQYAVPAEELDAWIDDYLERHRTPGPPFEQRLADGRWIRVEERRTRDGSTVGVRTDITDLKEREAELKAARDEAERANRGKSDYIHHLSHELRTPLNAVMGFAQIIAGEIMGPLGNERYRSYAQEIGAAGVYMLDLVSNLLDLARVEAGRMPLHEEACDLGLLVDATFAMVHPRAVAAGVTLANEAARECAPAVQGDPTLIRQMLTNLIGNAVKFARPPLGRVVVRAQHRNGGELVLSVEDNGIGMTAEQLPRALDAFGQVHARSLSAERGSGLGLPLTRALIELHGGRLEIDSAAGIGTSARLVFPEWRVCVLTDGEGI
ncbi:MAG TPA: PAS-domain containing protein [Azospirillum sp.]|nr:PAS-domain containing protein [Azospirillum sp.]